ncbi:MAG: hypothetical protein H7Z39_06210, partial [Burkholderiaceae bacterium]|nr:hypothetical protein [Burkholderiaceae bacterium]
MTRLVLRADASSTIGNGHVMRCLTLATVLRERGAHVTFVCRLLPGHLCDLLEQRGFGVRRLPAAPFDWREDATRTLAAAHRAYAQAAGLFAQNRFADAGPKLVSAQALLASAHSPFAHRVSA